MAEHRGAASAVVINRWTRCRKPACLSICWKVTMIRVGFGPWDGPKRHGLTEIEIR